MVLANSTMGNTEKGVGLTTCSLVSLVVVWMNIFAETDEDKQSARPYSYEGALSWLTCYIFAARDAYRSAKRINAERGYANLSEKVIPKRPTINLGMRGRGNMFLALNHTF